MEPRLPSPCHGDPYSPSKRTKQEDGTWLPSPSQMSIDSSVSPPPLVNGHSPTSSYDAYCSSKVMKSTAFMKDFPHSDVEQTYLFSSNILFYERASASSYVYLPFTALKSATIYCTLVSKLLQEMNASQD
ncbi:ecdysone receptor A isoform [Trichonephila inaurata madagascariensis]|uniref:Ecdysone receptor A isoform n=1 Tax=Trichonephila inaurata madagascariensis TaxID=2747483 RepID=A0A8X6Y3K7_9ARAC|nr:ecdysone receptor A isoform [Trichonephila inaurata madagascariensis]